MNGVGNVSGKSTWGGGGFNKAGLDGASEKMERLKNLFGFEILLEVFFERILILKEIYYGDDDEIYDDGNESDGGLNLNNVHDGI